MNTEFALPQGRRFSRKRIRSAGIVAAVSFALVGVGLLCLAFCYLSPELAPTLVYITGASLGAKALSGLSKGKFPGPFRAFTMLHEGAHFAYLLFRDVQTDQIELNTDTLNGPIVSLNMRNIPKDIWIGSLLFPLVLPLGIVLMGMCCPSFRLAATGLALLAMSGSGADIAYAIVGWRTPGDFVTITEDEIVIH